MHEPYVKQIEIKKPADLGPGRWNLTGLTAITTLFGKNGSGKSRLLRAWRDSDTRYCHYVVPERTGNISYEPGYLKQQSDADQRKGLSEHNFSDAYRSHVVTRIQAYFLTRGSVRGARLPGNPEDLEQLLTVLLPDFTTHLSGSADPPYTLLRSATQEKIGSIHQLSSGEAQLLTVALDILTIAAMWDIEQNERRIVLVDEPDAHIHPDLQVRFADFLIRVATKFKLQVALATHSTTLLAALGQFAAEEASVIYMDRIQSTFAAKPFSKEAKEIAACLGGHALMGPLFGVPLLLVEGDDDYRIWSQVPRYHCTSFSVIPANGDEIKQYQKSLETILAALREPKVPAGFALLDGDKQLPQANPDCPQNHIRYLQLECHESENLYLTDETLSLMGLDWAHASAKIVEKAGDFGQKSALLTGAMAWDRKAVDIKSLINELTSILDEKNVHWTIRVARAVGEKRPTGQLLEFLGKNVVEALWGPTAEPAEIAAE
ncbi:MAG: hypothetical protein BroJett030_14940 [Alphaproteobacteria bacterium]|nr:MAG: hypothetical protein BroJett030_14940 [Alphaproteobacteria bacterium]